MTLELQALCFMANDPAGLARFWAGVLGRELTEGDDGPALLPTDETEWRLRFIRTREPKAGPNQMHLDLTSTSLEDHHRTVERALGLGARHHDVGQGPKDGQVGLADPEGNEYWLVGSAAVRVRPAACRTGQAGRPRFSRRARRHSYATSSGFTRASSPGR